MSEMEVTRSEKTLVGIGEFALSDAPTQILIAPNLGSCLGMALYDPVARVGGVIHCLLPLSQVDPEKAAKRPAMYVDTGVTTLLEKVLMMGAQKNRLLIAAAGAGNINDEGGVFEIGKKNHTVFRKVLWKNGLLIKGEDVGNPHSVTLSLDLSTGEASAKSLNGVRRLF